MSEAILVSAIVSFDFLVPVEHALASLRIGLGHCRGGDLRLTHKNRDI